MLYSQPHTKHVRTISLITLWTVIVFTVFAQAQSLPRPTGGAQNVAPAARAITPLVWRDPGPITSLDFAGGAGGKQGAPQPPFTFLEENTKGTNPKVKVKDANGVEWSVKWGTEVNAETFATRMIWAAGYAVEPAYFVGSGKIEGATGLERAKSKVGADGSFTDARFERGKAKGVKKLEDEQSWSWVQNPFVGTKELNGLKVMVMLVSNWDNKDVRDVSRGSNTAIFQDGEHAVYVVTDWGGSMGKWGNFMSREKWDCKGYQSQTKSFVKGVKNGFVEFGYSGQHTKDFSNDIKVSDVQWLIARVGQITDAQIMEGLRASGATPEDQACYTRAVRERLTQLKGVK